MLLLVLLGCSSSKIENKMTFLPVDKELIDSGYTIIDKNTQHSVKHMNYKLVNEKEDKISITIEEYITTEDAINQMGIEKYNIETKIDKGSTKVLGQDGFEYLHASVLRKMEIGDYNLCTLDTFDDLSTYQTSHLVGKCITQRRRFVFYVTIESDNDIDFSEISDLFSLLLGRIG